MKQLTMTKVLTPIAALAFAFGVQAAAVSTDGFETETTTVVTNRTGWSFTYGTDGADDASAITAYPDAASKPSALPEAFVSAGDNYLKLSTEDGMLFRQMDPAANDGAVNFQSSAMFVDTDVQFTITDPSDRPTPTADDKFIIWLEDQGTATNLCVWAREFTVVNDEGAVNSNKVYSLRRADETALTITPGAWYRLTVKAISSVGADYKFPAFQVYLDGQLLKAGSSEFIVDNANVEAFKTKVGETVVTGQAYLPAMANSMDALSSVGFSGEGAIDNFAVTKDIPEFLPRQKITVWWDNTVLSAVTLLDANDNEVATLTTTGTSVVVDSTTVLHFSKDELDFVTPSASGSYDLTDPDVDDNWAVTGDTSLSLNEGVVTILAGSAEGGFRIALDMNNACVLTLTATGVTNTLDSIQSGSYTINSGEPVTLTADNFSDLDYTGMFQIDCAMGDEIVFAFTMKSGYAATLDNATGGTLSEFTFTVGANANEAGVRINIASTGPEIPEITPSASGETGATYTSADADTIVAEINANKSTYIKAPSGITDSTYASKFVASKVLVGDTYKIVVSLTSEAQTALQTDADAKAQSLAASLAGIAAGTVTEVSATGATPGFYYAVAYDTAVGGTYATKGTAGLASDAGAVTLTVPAKASGATAGFYKIVVSVTAE